MKQIIIIGARGLGRTVHGYLEEFDSYNREFKIKGFLDDNSDILNGYQGYSPILSSVDDYKVEEGDVFICALGENSFRRDFADRILSKGGKFINMIHPLARIARDAEMGIGCIIGPWSILESGAKIGDFCLLQTSAIIGHDVKVGCFSRFDSHAIAAGKAIVGDNVTIYTGAIINQSAEVGDNATVGAGSFVATKVSVGKTAFGNPAREF